MKHSLPFINEGNLFLFFPVSLTQNVPFSDAPICVDMKAATSEAQAVECGGEEEDGWESKAGRRRLRWRQFVALQTKRFHHTKRDPKALFCEVSTHMSGQNALNWQLSSFNHCVILYQCC